MTFFLIWDFLYIFDILRKHPSRLRPPKLNCWELRALNSRGGWANFGRRKQRPTYVKIRKKNWECFGFSLKGYIVFVIKWFHGEAHCNFKDIFPECTVLRESLDNFLDTILMMSEWSYGFRNYSWRKYIYICIPRYLTLSTGVSFSPFNLIETLDWGTLEWKNISSVLPSLKYNLSIAATMYKTSSPVLCS